jgi:hypothetical protein
MGEIGLPTRLFLKNSYYSSNYYVSTGQHGSDDHYLYGSLCSKSVFGRKPGTDVHGTMLVIWRGGVWPNCGDNYHIKRVTQNGPKFHIMVSFHGEYVEFLRQMKISWTLCEGYGGMWTF